MLRRIPAKAYIEARKMEWQIRRGQFFLLMVVFLNLGVQWLRFQVGYAVMDTSLIANVLPKSADFSQVMGWMIQLTLWVTLWLLFVYIGSRWAYFVMMGYWLWDGFSTYILSTTWETTAHTGLESLAPAGTVEYLQAIAFLDFLCVVILLVSPSIRMYLRYMQGRL